MHCHNLPKILFAMLRSRAYCGRPQALERNICSSDFRLSFRPWPHKLYECLQMVKNSKVKLRLQK